jgi:DNA helicase-2/ATP-dependent DNA helicase PcrA
MSLSSQILEGLNEVQAQIVSSDAPGMLVVAGAGSGKTRVLASRIAWLIRQGGISPRAILAVTFTNKAAREMQGRILHMLDGDAPGLSVGTFHGIANRMLYLNPNEAGLAPNYRILDSQDQLRMVKSIMAEGEYDETKYPPKKLTYLINDYKEEGMRSGDVPQHGGSDPHQARVLLDVYKKYEQECARQGVVDFAELLLRACEMLSNNEELRSYYCRRFEHILVDEFQDTNALQYRWLRLFYRPKQCVMAVGDDDQSIYGWRGARIENMEDFKEDYSAKLFKLEQNYRSTSNILNAANGVIAHNSSRLGKELWTEKVEGELISVYQARNEHHEADFVVERLNKWRNAGRRYREAAILYRSNAQSRVLEKELRSSQTPYKIIGGTGFYERQEVKDAMAYLRLVSRRDDDIAFRRAVGVPPRGVGAGTLEKLRQHGEPEGASLWHSAQHMLKTQALSAKISTALGAFMKMIDDLAQLAEHDSMQVLAERMLSESGLKDHYAKDSSEIGRGRVENLQELVQACGELDESGALANDLLQEEQQERSEPSGLERLELFLNDVSLDSTQQQDADSSDLVSMMTVHSAKGLEFPLVLMVGLEQGLFPHIHSITQGDIAEERRLCYVGITRAMEQLCISHAATRSSYGSESGAGKDCMPSCFISEIPKELLEHISPPSTGVASIGQRRMHRASNHAAHGGSGHHSSGATNSGRNDSIGGYKVGLRVSHPSFGDGVIIDLAKDGNAAIVGVNFQSVGFKRLMLDQANLSVLS